MTQGAPWHPRVETLSTRGVARRLARERGARAKTPSGTRLARAGFRGESMTGCGTAWLCGARGSDRTAGCIVGSSPGEPRDGQGKSNAVNAPRPLAKRAAQRASDTQPRTHIRPPGATVARPHRAPSRPRRATKHAKEASLYHVPTDNSANCFPRPPGPQGRTAPSGRSPRPSRPRGRRVLRRRAPDAVPPTPCPSPCCPAVRPEMRRPLAAKWWRGHDTDVVAPFSRRRRSTRTRPDAAPPHRTAGLAGEHTQGRGGGIRRGRSGKDCPAKAGFGRAARNDSSPATSEKGRRQPMTSSTPQGNHPPAAPARTRAALLCGGN